MCKSRYFKTKNIKNENCDSFDSTDKANVDVAKIINRCCLMCSAVVSQNVLMNVTSKIMLFTILLQVHFDSTIQG